MTLRPRRAPANSITRADAWRRLESKRQQTKLEAKHRGQKTFHSAVKMCSLSNGDPLSRDNQNREGVLVEHTEVLLWGTLVTLYTKPRTP